MDKTTGEDMKKRALSILLAAALILSVTVTSFADLQNAEAASGEMVSQTGAVSGENASTNQNPADYSRTRVSYFGSVYTFTNEIICKDGVYYIPIREMSDLMGAACTWDERSQGCWVTAADSSVTFGVSLDSDIIEAKGRLIPMEGSCIRYGNSFYIPARNFARVMGLSYWIDETYNKILFAGGQPLKSAAEFYNADDLKWMSRIIHAEAAGEIFKGKVAVGNVVMNRVKSPKFPNTVYNVIFAQNQFTPVKTGKINNTPSDASIRAAKLALEGYNVVPDCVYFTASKSAATSWIVRTRTFMYKIGNHRFYK